MKYLVLLSLVLVQSLTMGQPKETEALANGIIATLNGSEAVQALVKNRKIIKGQLEDIRLFSRHNKITAKTHTELQEAYTEYADVMNNIVDNLSADLRSIDSFRKLKGARLQKFINRFSKVYAADLQYAHEIYSTDLAPALEQAHFEAESKGGIVPALVMVVKFGQSIFTAIKDLFTTGTLSEKGEQQLLAAAMRLSIKGLEKQLKYPEWVDVMEAYTTTSFSGLQMRSAKPEPAWNSARSYSSNPAPVYRTMHGSVGLSTYKTDMPIKLMETSKSIVVGSESENVSLPLFTVSNPMQNGDRFWVTLDGYEFVSFFYFDETLGSWQDPFGKSIVVGSDENGKRTGTLYLPSPNQFFEITGDSVGEQFLIIVSNAPMPNDHRNLVLGNSSSGVTFVDDLNRLLPNVVGPQDTASDGTFMDRIPIHISGESQIYVPLYIQINKN